MSEMAGCAGICWSLVWLLLLLIGGWPIGGLCAGFYLLLSPFGACIEALTPLINLLEQGLKLPLTCALNMVHQKPLCWRASDSSRRELTGEIRNESAPIQPAHCRFPGQAFSNAEILAYFSYKIYGSNFIKQHSETVMVSNYQNANCRFKKKIVVIYYNFRHTFVPYVCPGSRSHRPCYPWHWPMAFSSGKLCSQRIGLLHTCKY